MNREQDASDIRDIICAILLFVAIMCCGCAPVEIAPGEAVTVTHDGYVIPAPATAPADFDSNPWAAHGDPDLRSTPAPEGTR